MSWKDQYQPGSFRGVPFLTQSHSAEGGRRVVTHEFPQRDEPWTEDLGRKARRWTIEALIIGADYMTGRDALVTALEASGAGRLVHPYLGEHSASVDTFSLTESTEEGGMARFSIQLVESGVTLARDARSDTADAAVARADAAKAGAKASFARDFSVAGRASFVTDAAARIGKRVAAVATRVANTLGGVGRLLRTVEAGIAALDGVVQLVRAPIDFARSIGQTIGAVAALGSVPLLRLRGLVAIATDIRSVVPVIGATPDREAERANQAALQSLVNIHVAAEAVTIVAGMTFASYPEAVALRDWLAGTFDDWEVAAADAGRIEEADTLGALRTALIRDVNARAANLARLMTFTPPASIPALVLAARLYGADGIEARTGEIVARNRIHHPGFVPGGVALSLLTVPEALRA